MVWNLTRNHAVTEEEFIICLRNRGELKARLMAMSKNPLFWSNLELRTSLDDRYEDTNYYSWKIT